MGKLGIGMPMENLKEKAIYVMEKNVAFGNFTETTEA